MRAATVPARSHRRVRVNCAGKEARGARGLAARAEPQATQPLIVLQRTIAGKWINRNYRKNAALEERRKLRKAGAGATAYFVIPYFLRNLSTRPAVSTIFCLPV